MESSSKPPAAEYPELEESCRKIVRPHHTLGGNRFLDCTKLYNYPICVLYNSQGSETPRKEYGGQEMELPMKHMYL